jgi:hypothetical protein
MHQVVPVFAGADARVMNFKKLPVEGGGLAALSNLGSVNYMYSMYSIGNVPTKKLSFYSISRLWI